MKNNVMRSKLYACFGAVLAILGSASQAFSQATILPPGEQCFQATTGINGMVGALGTITGGSLYTNGSYGGVALTGGSGTGATANITVSGGSVTGVAILNPGVNYVVGDTLSATSIGGTGSGFSVPVNSISINSSLAGGAVGYYIPNTLSVKQTWQDAGQSILNTNPVNLDSNGCATVYGSGIYRQIVKDSLGNTVWDKLTASTGGNGIFWAGLAGGTGNAITLTDTAFANQDGYTIQFLAKAANTGAATVSVSNGTPIEVVQDTSSGPASLTSGQIGPGNTPLITYDATNVQFHIVNPSASSSSTASTSLITPQGYLNLAGAASGSVVQTGDVVGASTIYYSPFVGDIIPIWNGSTFINTAFSELTATLTSAGSPSNTIQDSCVFSNNGVPTLVIGPSWTTVTAGSGSRGTGAGTAQITRLQGVWVNANIITAYNGLSSYTIAANQCTVVGSVSVDSTAGQVSAYRTWGQNRKFGVWNFYNRQPIYLKAGDPTASWSAATTTGRPSNNNTANSLTVFSGLPEQTFELRFIQFWNPSGGVGGGAQNIGIGFNSTTTTIGKVGSGGNNQGIGLNQDLVAEYFAPPSLGLNVITALEISGVNGGTIFGTERNMVLSAQWGG